MDNLKVKITEFVNKRNEYYGKEEVDFSQTIDCNKLDLPKELINFFSTIGEIELGEEDYCVYIYSETEGIIEMILKEDRPEFEDGENLTEEEIEKLDNNFKCFGFLSDCDGDESNNYLIFDKEGRYDNIYYHQDEFDDVLTKLKELLNNGIKNKSNLENFLSDQLENLKLHMIEFKDEE